MRIRSGSNPVHALIAHILNSFLRHSTIKYLSVLIALAVVTGMDCKDDPPVVPPPPPPYKQSIFLSVADSGLTEVYLKLSMTDTLPPRGYEIFRNNSKLLSGSLFGKETTLVDTTAQLNTSYFYRAFRLENTTRKDSSSIVTITTMDTTSHEFTWQVFEIGGAASSVIYDALIIDGKNIVTVGQFYINDSLGQVETTPYNMAYWDGIMWNYKRCYYKQNTDSLLFVPIRGILIDSEDNLWLAAGSIFRLSKNATLADLVYSRFLLPSTNGNIVKLYTDTKNRIYGVGNEGTIVKGDGTLWNIIQSGTTQPLTDIFGVSEHKNNNDEILCIGSSRTQYNGKVLLKINGNGVEQLSFEDIQGSMISLWFVPGQRYYVVGNGVYSKRSIGGDWRVESTFPSYYKNIVRGTGLNNIFIAGDFGLLSHYNGKTWKHFTDLENTASLRGLSVTDSLVVAVGGLTNGKAVVIIGKRNN